MMKKHRLTTWRLVSFYLITLVLVIAGCFAALYLAGFVPQTVLREHYISSAEQIESEGVFPYVFNKNAFNSRLDNHTESIIIMGSYYMDIATLPDSPISNPFIRLGVDEMTTVAKDDSIKADSFYIRYWMGFRSIIRPLLAFFDYGEIRTLISFFFYLLLIVTAFIIARHSNMMIGLSFFLSILALNPILIGNSIQFSSIFFISFIFTMFVPKLKKRGIKYYALYFALSGIFTQYFDFYTAPLLTAGLPLAFLLVMHQIDNQPGDSMQSLARIILICSVSWFLGYVLMWIIKLLLITITMEYDGLKAGLDSFKWRIGIVKDETYMESYSVLLANAKALAALVSTTTIGIILASILLLSGTYLFVKLMQKGSVRIWLQHSWPFFVLAFIPFVWFSVAAQPTFLHYWFQYRPLGITVFCVLIIYSHAISIVWPSMNRKLSVTNAEQ